MGVFDDTIKAHNAAIQERQVKDRQIARQALYEARERIARAEYKPAVAHVLVGILALQMSES